MRLWESRWIAWCVGVCTTTAFFFVLASVVQKYPGIPTAKGTKNKGIIRIIHMFFVGYVKSPPLAALGLVGFSGG